MNKSFAEAIQSKKNRLYDLRYTSDDGESVYYFFLADPLKEKMFLKKWEGNEELDLNDFGEIINAGYGVPSEDLKSEMVDRFGIVYG